MQPRKLYSERKRLHYSKSVTRISKVIFRRPATNGMFIAIPVNLRNEVKEIFPNSSRVQAILLDTDNEKSVIINTYFSQDPKTVTYELDSDLEDALTVIENMTDSYQCKNVLIVGDLNTDFIRKTNVSKGSRGFFHPIPSRQPGRYSMLITPMNLRRTE